VKGGWITEFKQTENFENAIAYKSRRLKDCGRSGGGDE